MKKFARTACLLAMMCLIFSMSGCGGGSSGGGGDSGNGQDQTAGDRLMVVTSPVLKQGESYQLFRGRNIGTMEDHEATYYVAPITAGQSVTMNLQFENELGADQPFMITDTDNKVVFYYNPSGNGETDTTTPYGNLTRLGGGTNQLSYNGLTIQSSAIDLGESDEEVVITLSGTTATVNGSVVTPYNYVWHADPDHRDEYYTLGDSTTELTESAMLQNITNVEGVYINHDIRYMPNTIEFTGTVRNDEEQEYAAYYSDSVAQEVASELGTGFEGPYIFATLPMSMGMGGPGGGTPPHMQSAVSNSDIEAFSTMTHSASEAFNNPVLHITGSGVYRLKGTWTGQIWVEAGSEEDDKVALILDGVNVTCTVAPALVFKEVYECGPDDESTVASSWRTVGETLHSENGTNAGAIVVIADGTTNSFTGTNVYRMLKAEKKKDSVTAIDGTDVSQQKKRYKMDGAFYSFQSMVIGGESNPGTGRLNITSTNYEGLDTEMHLLIDSGIVTVTAEDDGINVNEDDTSVFTMNGGSLTITSKNGDGIDSNGYIVLNGGTLDITAAQDTEDGIAQAEGPLDSAVNNGIYISDEVDFTHQAYSGEDGSYDGGENGDIAPAPTSSRDPITVSDSSGNVVMSITYDSPVEDTDTTDREIDSTGDVFTLTHRVNNFSGVK